jgi:hypothetical protein
MNTRANKLQAKTSLEGKKETVKTAIKEATWFGGKKEKLYR